MPYITTYATTADLKARLGIDPTDTTWDSVLSEVLTSASRAIDAWCHRRFGQDDTPTTRTYWATNLQYLLVDDVSTASGFVLQTDGGKTWTVVDDLSTTPTTTADALLGPRNSSYEGRPYTRVESLGRFFIPYPIGPLGQVFVTARFGWPAVPTLVNEACLIQASRLYKRKDAPLGVLGSPELGSGVTRLLARLDPDVELMLQTYRRPRWRPT